MKPKKNKFVRALLIVAGTISLAFGIIGTVVPLIPYTPFFLLTLACYCRSSERLYTWFINNRLFGKFIKNYQEGRGIHMKTKVFAIVVLWGTISVSAFVFLPIMTIPMPIWIIQIILVIIASAVSIHILRQPTLKKEKS